MALGGVAVTTALVLALTGLAQAKGSAVRMVADINPGTAGSGPGGVSAISDHSVLFAAFEASAGRELWRSDHPYSESATHLVKDIRPGSASSAPGGLTKSGHAFYFSAIDGVHGTELWMTDGTAEGTVLVKDINPGVGSSSPIGFTDVDGTLFFTASDPQHGRELWKSDGTAEGTELVSDISPGSTGSFAGDLENVNGTLFFSAAGDGFLELWKSDGTAEGTVMVKDINGGPGSSDPTFLTDVGGTLFFLANDDVTGGELWKSDGTAEGTVLVKDIDPIGSSLPTGLIDVHGTLFFVATESDHGRELWKSDGTTEGTVMVKDIAAGPDSAFPDNPFFVRDVSLATVGRRLFFAALEPEHGRELWKSDGTDKGTVLVKDINPGPANSIPRRPFNPLGVISANLTKIEDGVIFRALDPAHGLEPWVSDGSDEGTVLVADINPGPTASIPDTSTGFFAHVEGAALFTAAAGCTTTTVCDSELWRTLPPIR